MRRRHPGAEATAVAVAAALVLAAVAVGWVVNHRGGALHADAAPLYGDWRPRIGPLSLLPLTVAVAVVSWGPRLAERVRWPLALALTGAAGVAWIVTLALVDGTNGLLAPLASPSEYPADVPRVRSVSSLLSGFVGSVPADSADPWTTHVAGHPPGALLVFVGLDRFGLSGPWPPIVLCVAGGVAAVLAVCVACRLLCGEALARRVLPFAALLPAAVWVGVSFDAVVAGVGAWALALVAVAVTAQRTAVRAAALAGGGGLLGIACLLSYGAVLLVVPALAVVVVGTRDPTRRAATALGAAGMAGAVLVLAAGGGFSWWEGYQAVRQRYLDGFGGSRPYAYWVWADLAALAVAVGPAVAAGVGRLVADRHRPWSGPATLVGGSLLALALAAASGMSKAEVERIWLPWMVWLVVATGVVPRRQVRGWLALQALTGLVVQHLVATGW